MFIAVHNADGVRHQRDGVVDIMLGVAAKNHKTPLLLVIQKA
jgi:hypothetical protein